MRKIDEVYVMNYNDDDELERLRARNRRGTRRSPAAAGPGTGRQIPPSRNGKQDSRGHYDEEYYYDEEFGQEEYGREAYGRVENRWNRQSQDGFGYRDGYGFGGGEDSGDGDGFGDSIIEDEPEYRRSNRRVSPTVRSSRSGKAARAVAGGAASKSRRPVRPAADTAGLSRPLFLR